MKKSPRLKSSPPKELACPQEVREHTPSRHGSRRMLLHLWLPQYLTLGLHRQVKFQQAIRQFFLTLARIGTIILAPQSHPQPSLLYACWCSTVVHRATRNSRHRVFGGSSSNMKKEMQRKQDKKLELKNPSNWRGKSRIQRKDGEICPSRNAWKNCGKRQ